MCKECRLMTDTYIMKGRQVIYEKKHTANPAGKSEDEPLPEEAVQQLRADYDAFFGLFHR
ncbi:hypothetical protein D3C74_466100 [compost metagenome]